MSTAPDPAAPAFQSTHNPVVPSILADLGCSLALTTYQAGKVILVASDGAGLQHLPRTFDHPMGLAVEGARMALATQDRIVQLADEPRLAASHPDHPGRYDALWVPRSSHYCGYLNVHDLAWGSDGLVGVSTAFSCLFALDEAHSFRPVWCPPFVSALTSEDRCHLNGLALAPDGDGSAYATALGVSDVPQGWRGSMPDGGVLLSVPDGEIVLDGLAMPHSPRWIEGELYLLEAARGELVAVDRDDGTREVVQRLPGFARGLAAFGDYLFIGLSRLRPGRLFDGLPLDAESTICGVAVVHRLSGALVGMIEYLSTCDEIYDVQVLPAMRRPGILGLESSMHLRSLSTPDETFWMAPGTNGETPWRETNAP